MKFDGILLVDKEQGWTSFDIVAKTRNILQQEYFDKTGEKKKIKVGHCGTLDPLATGLMIIVVGSYCKRASEFSKLDKVYEVQMKLGETSTTGDEEGAKIQGSSLRPSKEDLGAVLQSFVGESEQLPPAFSAKKVNGQRAYKLARQGQTVELKPQKITIYDIKLSDYAYPYVNFTVKVSSGTYIRSLVEDVGKILKSGAYMSELSRVKVGNFDLKNAIKVSKVSSKNIIAIDKKG